jgi:hypothetical protein
VAVCEAVSVAADDQCMACASVDAGSYDPDGEPWTVVESPTCDYGLGDTDVTLTITDPFGESDTCTAAVTVYDDTAPSVTVADTINIWPPNHKYHTFTLADCVVEATDNCQEIDVMAHGSILSAYSDEPENAKGDGNTTGDIVILSSNEFQVRAERQGKGNGRVYGVSFAVSDASGNSTTATCRVAVAHDQSGAAAIDDGPAAGYSVP